MKNVISEDQVIDYIKYDIRKIIEVNHITKEEAVESVRYYFDYLINSVARQMEN